MDGVEEGQTLASARSACPDLVVLAPDHGAFADARRAVHEALLLVSPRVEWSGGGTFCLEAGGLSAIHGSERGVLARSIEALSEAGFIARAACASTRLAASVAARLRSGAIVIPPGGEAAFLAPLPLSALPLGPETLRRLDLLGIRSVGTFAKLPPAGLADRFGREVARWQRLARGEDPAPLLSMSGTSCASAVRELDDPVEGLEAVTFLLKSCCEELCDELARRGSLAARIELALALDGAGRESRGDSRGDSRVLEPSRPLGSSRAILALCRLELEERRVSAPILGLALSVLEERPARGLSGEMFGESLDPEALGAALDRVRALVGSEDVVAPAPKQAHRREARLGWTPFCIETPGRRAGEAIAAGDAGPGTPRLSPRGEPSTGAALLSQGATIPDDPSVDADADADADGGACAGAVGTAVLRAEMLPGERLLESPVPVIVRLPGEAPGAPPGALHSGAAARQALGLPEHLEIVSARGPWRACGEWWEGGADVDRDEWLLQSAEGGAYRAVRDRRTREWSLLGVVD